MKHPKDILLNQCIKQSDAYVQSQAKACGFLAPTKMNALDTGARLRPQGKTAGMKDKYFDTQT